MQDEKNDFYSQAHLFVAAIRIHQHLKSRPPTVEDICQIVHFSVEQGNFICRKLEDMEIVKAVEGSYGNRLFIRDHLKIEDIPRGQEDHRLEEELKKFQETQKALTQKVASFQVKQEQKKKNLFAEMEKKLKEELEKKSKPPDPNKSN